MREETMKELAGPLRQAVEQVHHRPVPEDALATTLDRVRNQQPAVANVAPPKPTPRRRRWSRVLAITVVLMAWIGAAGAFAVQDWNESQRRLMAANNLREIGLAVHNFADVNQAYLAYSPNAGYIVDDVKFFDPPSELRLPELDIDFTGGTIAGLRRPTRSDGRYEVYGKPPNLDVTDGTSNIASVSEGNDVENRRANPNSAVAAADGAVRFDHPPSSVQAQRVIHTAEISLVTKDVLKLEQELRELLEQFEGYTAEAQVNQPQGDLRSARWVVRVPVDKFTAFLDAAAALGIPEYRRANAQDVTEEYVDVKARIANQKMLEQRLLDLLAERDGDLKDVIAVEQQLNVIRGQIEQSEGRQKYLEHQTDLASAVIVAREESQYVPPQARGIGSEVRLAWSNSLDALGRFGKGLVVTAVAGGPWLVLAAIPLALVVRWFRRWRRRRATKSSV